jgi:hypothetical protein
MAELPTGRDATGGGLHFRAIVLRGQPVDRFEDEGRCVVVKGHDRGSGACSVDLRAALR